MKNETVLCVGNFDSDTGYAWRLIELLWVNIAQITQNEYQKCIVVYPTVTTINQNLLDTGIHVEAFEYKTKNIVNLTQTIIFILKNNVKILYLTDRPVISLFYFFFKLVGVKKIIVHDHTPGYRPPVLGVKRLLKELVHSIPIVTADAVIGVSPYVCTRLELTNCFPSEKIYSVINGLIDTNYVKNYSDDSAKKINIVTVARVNRYKGIDFAIRVMQILINELDINNIFYEVIGDGPDLDEFKNRAKNSGLANHINFLGGQSDISKMLPTYDIAFHPSKGEAMCLAIVEYMRAALPVVTSTNISVNSILVEKEDALFYNEFDEYSAADVLSKLINSSVTRRELGIGARNNYLNKYQSENMLGQFRESIETIITK